MLIQVILFLLAGILFGTITGLTPGIHINLISSIILSAYTGLLMKIPQTYLIIFIVSMAITHTFIDFIPSIFIGAPDDDTILSILPGHELLKDGRGYQAIVLTAYGSITAIFILIFISYPSILIIKKLADPIQNLVPYLLIISSLFLILTERKKIQATTVFFLTGLLGFCVLTLGETNMIKEPLLPMLSGLFGASMIITTIKSSPEIIPQIIKKPRINPIKTSLISTISSPLCSFLPGLGAGQAAIIGSSLMSSKKNNTSKEEFLILLGATNTLVMGFSFIALYAISKTRTGASLAIKELMPNIPSSMLILILLTTFISGIIAYFLTIFLAEIFSKNIQRVNYKKTSIGILIFLTGIILLFTGIVGLLVFAVSTATGIFCINLGSRRTNMMGCLLLPIIIFYLTNSF